MAGQGRVGGYEGRRREPVKIVNWLIGQARGAADNMSLIDITSPRARKIAPACFCRTDRVCFLFRADVLVCYYRKVRYFFVFVSFRFVLFLLMLVYVSDFD